MNSKAVLNLPCVNNLQSRLVGFSSLRKAMQQHFQALPVRTRCFSSENKVIASQIGSGRAGTEVPGRRARKFTPGASRAASWGARRVYSYQVREALRHIIGSRLLGAGRFGSHQVRETPCVTGGVTQSVTS